MVGEVKVSNRPLELDLGMEVTKPGTGPIGLDRGALRPQWFTTVLFVSIHQNQNPLTIHTKPSNVSRGSWENCVKIETISMISHISMRLPLADGGFIVLCDMSDSAASISDDAIDRNVYRLNAEGETVWQISPPPGVRPRTPFTNIYVDSAGSLRAFRFDCYEHEVNIDTGQTKIVDFLK